MWRVYWGAAWQWNLTIYWQVLEPGNLSYQILIDNELKSMTGIDLKTNFQDHVEAVLSGDTPSPFFDKTSDVEFSYIGNRVYLVADILEQFFFWVSSKEMTIASWYSWGRNTMQWKGKPQLTNVPDEETEEQRKIQNHIIPMITGFVLYVLFVAANHCALKSALIWNDSSLR